MLPTVTLTLSRDRFPLLHPLLRRGFWVRARAGSSLRAVLTGDLGLSGEAVRERIQTVLLDGDVVDDLDATYPAAHSTLALSAAMPGLLGACFRRGGAFAGLRGSITSGKQAPDPGGDTKEVRVKLYNLLTGEWGDFLLERGIAVEAGELRALAEERFPELRDALQGARLDEKGVTSRELSDWLGNRPHRERILLRLVEA
jgi:hypothetical protein